MRILPAPFILCLLASVPAAAQSAPQDDRKVCKTVEGTGSRFATRRVCQTAGDWKLMEQEAAKALFDRQMKTPSPPSIDTPAPR